MQTIFLAHPATPCSCALWYNEQEQWFQAAWRGSSNPAGVRQQALAFLACAAQRPSPYLLHNTARLHGAWADSLDWLLAVWLPKARRLGLRYVAHVMQADPYFDIFTDRLLRAGPLPLELQLFSNVADARQWLRDQRDAISVLSA